MKMPVAFYSRKSNPPPFPDGVGAGKESWKEADGSKFGPKIEETDGRFKSEELAELHPRTYKEEYPAPKAGTFKSDANPKKLGWEFYTILAIGSAIFYLNYDNNRVMKDIVYDLSRKNLPLAYNPDEFTDLEVGGIKIKL